jgi:hypothetical protein
MLLLLPKMGQNSISKIIANFAFLYHPRFSLETTNDPFVNFVSVAPFSSTYSEYN